MLCPFEVSKPRSIANQFTELSYSKPIKDQSNCWYCPSKKFWQIKSFVEIQVVEMLHQVKAIVKSR